MSTETPLPVLSDHEKVDYLLRSLRIEGAHQVRRLRQQLDALPERIRDQFLGTDTTVDYVDLGDRSQVKILASESDYVEFHGPRGSGKSALVALAAKTINADSGPGGDTIAIVLNSREIELEVEGAPQDIRDELPGIWETLLWSLLLKEVVRGLSAALMTRENAKRSLLRDLRGMFLGATSFDGLLKDIEELASDLLAGRLSRATEIVPRLQSIDRTVGRTLGERSKVEVEGGTKPRWLAGLPILELELKGGYKTEKEKSDLDREAVTLYRAVLDLYNKLIGRFISILRANKISTMYVFFDDFTEARRDIQEVVAAFFKRLLHPSLEGQNFKPKVRVSTYSRHLILELVRDRTQRPVVLATTDPFQLYCRHLNHSVDFVHRRFGEHVGNVLEKKLPAVGYTSLKDLLPALKGDHKEFLSKLYQYSGGSFRDMARILQDTWMAEEDRIWVRATDIWREYEDRLLRASRDFIRDRRIQQRYRSALEPFFTQHIDAEFGSRRKPLGVLVERRFFAASTRAVRALDPVRAYGFVYPITTLGGIPGQPVLFSLNLGLVSARAPRSEYIPASVSPAKLEDKLEESCVKLDDMLKEFLDPLWSEPLVALSERGSPGA